MQKNAFGFFISYIKINSKWIKYLSIESKTIKLIEENIGVNLIFDNGILDMTQKHKQQDKN